MTGVTQIGFPVLTVSETHEGVRIRQDRFLETGRGEGADNETIWFVHKLSPCRATSADYGQRKVPLRILTADANGKAAVDNTALLAEREQFFSIDTDSSFKLNSGTTGVCKHGFYCYHLR